MGFVSKPGRCYNVKDWWYLWLELWAGFSVVLFFNPDLIPLSYALILG